LYLRFHCVWDVQLVNCFESHTKQTKRQFKRERERERERERVQEREREFKRERESSREREPLDKGEKALVPKNREKTFFVSETCKVFDHSFDETIRKVVFFIEDHSNEDTRWSIVRELWLDWRKRMRSLSKERFGGGKEEKEREKRREKYLHQRVS